MSVRLPINAGDLAEKDRAEVIDWVSNLGIDPRDVQPYIGIRRTESGGYEILMTRYQRNEAGKLIWIGEGKPATVPLTFGIGTERTWPKALDPCAPPAP